MADRRQKLLLHKISDTFLRHANTISQLMSWRQYTAYIWVGEDKFQDNLTDLILTKMPVSMFSEEKKCYTEFSKSVLRAGSYGFFLTFVNLYQLLQLDFEEEGFKISHKPFVIFHSVLSHQFEGPTEFPESHGNIASMVRKPDVHPSCFYRLVFQQRTKVVVD